VVVALTALAVVIGYTDRVNMSVAAVAMKTRLGWSQTEKGLILSAFFVGYILFMFISGALATRYGGKRVLGLAVLAWSLLTLATPFAAALSVPVLIAARIAMGLSEAAMFPCSYELFGRWVPAAERGRSVARLLTGVPLGTLLGLLATGWIVARLGWQMAFYVFGIVGLGWVFVWFSTVHNDPATDRRLSDAERALLPRQAPAAQASIPWRRLLLRRPVCGIATAHFATTWSLYVLLSWLPSYFSEVQGLSIANAGAFSAAPWLAMIVVTNLSGVACDRMIRRGVSVTAARKLMQCGGLIISAACLLAMRGLHSAGIAETLLCGATGALGMCWCGCTPAMIDVAPRHAALVGAFSNTIATIPGIVGVAVVGWLIDVTGTYSAAFVLTALVSGIGALVFGLLFDARPLVD
jgi:ACS family sodium-dependent inorganic phosphate cotransporter